MRHAILRLAGANGSGKSTAMRELLENYPCRALEREGRIFAYRLDLSEAGLAVPVFVVGRYDRPSGGVDCLKTQAEIAAGLLEAHALGHALYEGAVVSSCGPGGQVVRAVHATGCDVYAFMDTPLDVCIERVRGRRLVAGNAKAFDPRNLIRKFRSVARCRGNLLSGGYAVRLIDHGGARAALLEILCEFEKDAPSRPGDLPGHGAGPEAQEQDRSVRDGDSGRASVGGSGLCEGPLGAG